MFFFRLFSLSVVQMRPSSALARLKYMTVYAVCDSLTSASSLVPSSNTRARARDGRRSPPAILPAARAPRLYAVPALICDLSVFNTCIKQCSVTFIRLGSSTGYTPLACSELALVFFVRCFSSFFACMFARALTPTRFFFCFAFA